MVIYLRKSSFFLGKNNANTLTAGESLILNLVRFVQGSDTNIRMVHTDI